MKMKRRACLIALLLLLGMLINIGAAWACALWLDPTANDSFPPRRSGFDLGRSWQSPDDAPQPYSRWRVDVHRRFGGTIIRSSWLDPDVGHGFSGIIPDGPPGPHLPWWSPGFLVPPEHPLTTSQFHYHSVQAWGVPFLSLYSVWSGGEPAFGDTAELAGGIPIAAAGRAGWLGATGPARALPLIPIWLGFILNTIIYAALLWLIVKAFGLRRLLRIRRGLCPECAYPMGASPICTECGGKLARSA